MTIEIIAEAAIIVGAEDEEEKHQEEISDDDDEDEDEEEPAERATKGLTDWQTEKSKEMISEILVLLIIKHCQPMYLSD